MLAISRDCLRIPFALLWLCYSVPCIVLLAERMRWRVSSLVLFFGCWEYMLWCNVEFQGMFRSIRLNISLGCCIVIMSAMCLYAECWISKDKLLESRWINSLIEGKPTVFLIVSLDTYQGLSVIILRTVDWILSNFFQLSLVMFGVQDGPA